MKGPEFLEKKYQPHCLLNQPNGDLWSECSRAGFPPHKHRQPPAVSPLTSLTMAERREARDGKPSGRSEKSEVKRKASMLTESMSLGVCSSKCGSWTEPSTSPGPLTGHHLG